MACEACERMLSSEIVQPHHGLQALGRRRKLRALLRRPVTVQLYSCRLCSVNWMHERNGLGPDRSEWTCLFSSANILDPAIDLQSTESLTGENQNSEKGPTGPQHDELLLHRFS